MVQDDNGSFVQLRICYEATRSYCYLSKAVYGILRASLGDAVPPSLPQKQQSDPSQPRTDLQKQLYNVLHPIIHLVGEAMPHVDCKSPHKGDTTKRGLLLIPNAIFSNKRDMYDALKHQLPRMGYDYFTELWRRYFWHVQLKKWNPFAKCDECVHLRFR